MSHIDKNHNDMRVLLVDDEKGFLDVLSYRLARRFIKAVKVFSGTEAIQMLRKTDFDVVVLDLKMDDMDGIEVLKVIRAMDTDLPVIILTGHGTLETERKGAVLGAFDYLSKPCELVMLMDKIQQAYKARKNPDNPTG